MTKTYTLRYKLYYKGANIDWYKVQRKYWIFWITKESWLTELDALQYIENYCHILKKQNKQKKETLHKKPIKVQCVCDE